MNKYTNKYIIQYVGVQVKSCQVTGESLLWVYYDFIEPVQRLFNSDNIPYSDLTPDNVVNIFYAVIYRN